MMIGPSFRKARAILILELTRNGYLLTKILAQAELPFKMVLLQL
ncbi:hypothetical protein [Microvirga aerophila]